MDDVPLTHASGHVLMARIHHPLRGDLLGQQLCVWQQALPERLDVLRATAVGIPTIDGGEVQVRVVRRHRSQHPRCSVEQPVGDEGPDLIRNLRQPDGGRAGTWRRPEDLRDDKLGNIVDLVKFPLESTSLFKGLSQRLCIPAKRRLGRL